MGKRCTIPSCACLRLAEWKSGEWLSECNDTAPSTYDRDTAELLKKCGPEPPTPQEVFSTLLPSMEFSKSLPAMPGQPVFDAAWESECHERVVHPTSPDLLPWNVELFGL